MGKACSPCSPVPQNPNFHPNNCLTLFIFHLFPLFPLFPNRKEVSATFVKTPVPPVPPVPSPKTTPLSNTFGILPVPPVPPHPPSCPDSARPPESRSRAPSHALAAALWTQGVPIPVHMPAPSRSLLFPHTRLALFIFPFAVRFSFWVYTIFYFCFNSRFSFSFRAFISIMKSFLFFSQHFRIFRRMKCPPLFATLLQKMSQCHSRTRFSLYGKNHPLFFGCAPPFSTCFELWGIGADCDGTTTTTAKATKKEKQS